MNGSKQPLRYLLPVCLLLFAITPALHAQDWVHTGTNLGVQHIRIAVASFKPNNDNLKTLPLKSVFDQTLFNDLKNAGVFDMVSPSMVPPTMPGTPAEIHLSDWAAAPASADMVVFGNIAVTGNQVTVQGFLFDAKNPTTPQILGKQFTDNANDEATRQIAHRFADEIILRLSGINGICETHIYFVSNRSGHKEIWVMDYDGQNAHQITHLHSDALSPRISPDNSRLAFSVLTPDGWAIRMYSLTLHRLVYFRAPVGNSFSPAWSSDGTKLAFSASGRSGDNEIYTINANGGDLRRITTFRGPDVSPVWNPKTNSQIAWVSGRTGLPQIYIMNSDGSGIQRMTDGGYAVSPSWSPNGQFLAFAWNRHYGPGVLGGQDIYVMNIANLNWIEVTHGEGTNDFPSWSPDDRHIVFQRGDQIWTMLADGTDQQQLTHIGENTMPNWSWK